MNSSRRKIIPGILLCLAAIGVTAASFLSGFPSFHLLAFLPAIALAMAFAAGTGPAVFVAIAASVAPVFADAERLGDGGSQLPMLIAAGWLGIFLVDWFTRREESRRRSDEYARVTIAEESRAIRKEISFYEARATGLSQRSELRRRLSSVAVELGSILEPARIQSTLLSVAQSIFPGATVSMHAPDNAGVAAPVFQRGQALLASDADGTLSVMAAPVKSKRSVIAALSVSAPSPARVFAQEDLRLLDVLTGLASEALENAELLDSVHQNALRDGLTGLLTHRAFQDRLETALLEASRYHKPAALIMADIDHFKSVNDSHGHPAGDAVLQGFAHVLDRNLRDVDVVSRYGGEEFVILLYETGYAEALETAERIRRDLDEQPFDIGGGATLSVTASFGVSSFPDDATSGQQLLRQADQRLYAAKHGGRNRVVGR